MSANRDEIKDHEYTHMRELNKGNPTVYYYGREFRYKPNHGID